MKLLFICTHNRCRSILAEAITTHISEGKLEAKSAGSAPAGQVHPLTLEYLQRAGISIEGLKSQSWDEFEHYNPDCVITVCDSAANEPCPFWFAPDLTVHWSLSDPSKISDSEIQQQKAFESVINTLKNRLTLLQSYLAEGHSIDQVITYMKTLSCE